MLSLCWKLYRQKQPFIRWLPRPSVRGAAAKVAKSFDYIGSVAEVTTKRLHGWNVLWQHHPIAYEDIEMEALALLLVVILWFLHSRKITELNKRIAALETDLTEYWKEIDQK